jgi:phosphoglycerate dehydrogenase-like enzyme
LTVHVWIPATTRAEHRALLPAGAVVHDTPAEGPLPDRLGPGQFVVATFSPERLMEMVPRLDDLRVVQTMSAGVDRFIGRLPDGVILCDGSGIHDVSVAEWVVMTVLASRHHLPVHVEGQLAAHWQSGEGTGGDDLEEATILILGYGSIGRAVEARLAPFGARFLRVALHERPGVWPVTELPTLLPEADVVVLLLPLTAATRGLVDAGFLSRMAPGALLVNACRGQVVDTDALLEAVSGGRITAALDVTDPEPLPDGHPLWSAPGVLITPHVAGWVNKRLSRSWRLVADQLDRFMRGLPLRNVVADGY